MKKKYLLYSCFVDLFVIYSLSIIFKRIINNYYFINFVFIFLTTVVLYHLISYLLAKRTFGQCVFEIALKIENTRKKIKTILFRELLKFIFLIFCPFGILFLFGFDITSIDSILMIISHDIIIILIFYLIKKELFWSYFSTTYKIQAKTQRKKRIINSVILLSFICLIYVFLIIDNNTYSYKSRNILGFNFPFKYQEYPLNSNVEPYIKFLSNNDFLSSKDYVLNLFDKYDIVVLCENIHGETTQWDLYYDIINDEKFINNIGHVFTEYGSANMQNKLDFILNNKYEKDEILREDLLTLGFFDYACFYPFLERVNKLNSNLSDSLKIQIHFTDIKGLWTSPQNIDENEIKNRDNLMAKVLIDWYKENRKKCLLITNFRHAFILNAKEKFPDLYNEYFYKNEAQKIYDSFPEQTANVLVDGIALKLIPYHVPAHNGKWKTSFKANGYKQVGFDFKDTPFGKDSFDKRYNTRHNKSLLYQDVFTGMIFNKPEEEYQMLRPSFSDLSKMKTVPMYEYNLWIYLLFFIENFIDIFFFILGSFIIIFILIKNLSFRQKI